MRLYIKLGQMLLLIYLFIVRFFFSSSPFQQHNASNVDDCLWRLFDTV